MRDDRWMDAAARVAALGLPPTFAGLTWETYPGTIPPELIAWRNSWIACGATKAATVVTLYGPTGVGKSSLAVDLLRQLARVRPIGPSGWREIFEHAPDGPPYPIPFAYQRWSQYTRRVNADRYAGRPTILDGWTQVLVVDELDVFRETQRTSGEHLLDLLEWATDGHGLILVTNVDVADWTDAFGDRQADRMGARSALRIAFTGNSYR